MIDLEVAMAAYKRTVETAELTRHPILWVGYWNHNYLGHIHASIYSDDLVFYLAAPFATTAEVTTLFMVVDKLSALRVARLRVGERGNWTTFWTVPYSVDDRGRLGFGVGVKAPGLPHISRTLSFVSTERLHRTPRLSYGQALGAALRLARESG